jgi:small ligand-binding sensory domain FIST
MPAVAALSQHPETADATAEVVGQVLDRVGAGPELAVVFASAHHTDALAEVAGAIRTLLSPGRLVGATTSGVISGTHEVEEGPALALWAASLDAVPAAVRLTAATTSVGAAVQGVQTLLDAGGDRTAVLLADPFSLPMAEVLDVVAAADPPVRVVGGMASGTITPGGNRLLLDDEVFDDGAVGVLLDTDQVVVSQGCRPVGVPLIVTQAEGSEVLELAGRPTLQRLEEVVRTISAEDRTLLAAGLHLGLVADEHKADFDRGDFLVRGVVGADRSRGSLTVGARVEVGTTVQFHVRDAASADDDLRALLAAREAGSALLFSCTGRGQHLFGTPDHDAELVAAITPSGAVGGMFCAGEIGPVGSRSFLHSFTACVVLLGG